MSAIDFLDVEDVLLVHAHQIERFGGAPGVRDPALLESAVAQPMATYGGEFVHVGLYQMAAAYYFHLVSNHAFVDGNKRIGLAAALTFLELNGVTIDSGTDELFELTMEVAQGRAGKEKIATVLMELASRPHSG